VVYFSNTIRAEPFFPHVRILYSLAIYLLTPLLLTHLAFRGLRDRRYLKRWGERFALGLGRKLPELKPGGLVVHAVSVGEVNAAAPLIRALLDAYPQHSLTVTCFTPTGSERLRELFPDEIHHIYLPLDLPGAVRRFFRAVQPRLLIVMETEIWLNLYHQASVGGIPILLANARISQSSLPAYRRLKPLTSAALQKVSLISAQSKADADRFFELGAHREQTLVNGNLKFDIKLPDSLPQTGKQLRRDWGPQRPVVVGGSTHEVDELALLSAFKGVSRHLPGALLVLAPRHPERFDRAAENAVAAGFTVHRFSAGGPVPGQAQCLLVDAMGQLLACYAAGDVAFVGGSLQNHGGHNMLEPAALGCPVLMGPHTFNFEEISARLLDCGAAHQVLDASELETAVLELLRDADLREKMGNAGLALVEAGQGALARTLKAVDDLLDRG